MKVIRVRNVHQALPLGLRYLAESGIPMPSRAGDVIVAPGPVTTVYEKPCERVTFYSERDANPAFHLFESLYFFAGRNDLKFLTKFVKRFKQFSNDGVTVSGSYGYRWRKHWDIDQIERIVQLLKIQPFSRRAVLTMFDPAEDLCADESSNLDIPCNLSVIFQVGYGRKDELNQLHMTVPCRSNDIIFGCYGSNVVHFSMLHEYMASRLGLIVGIYYQMSNNYHMYLEVANKIRKGALARGADPGSNPYETGEVSPYPLVADPTTWDQDLVRFLEDPAANNFNNPFFSEVAAPVWWAHAATKRHAYTNALEIIEECKASDWRKAMKEWIQRRQVRWANKRLAELKAEGRVLIQEGDNG